MLKDWKKIGVNHWKKYKPINLDLIIFKNMSSDVWNVTVKQFYSNYYYVDKKFKTKAQAMKFAKDYMRKH